MRSRSSPSSRRIGASRKRRDTPWTSGSRRDLPKADNRVTLADDENVRLTYHSTNDEEADRLYNELKGILNHGGLADHHVLDKNFYMHMSIDRRRGPSGRNVPVRLRSCERRPGRQLQSSRNRQSLRGGYELLPEHRGGESGADRHGERDQGRGASARADGVAAGQRRAVLRRNDERPAGRQPASST